MKSRLVLITSGLIFLNIAPAFAGNLSTLYQASGAASSLCSSSATNVFYTVPNPTGTATDVTCVITECSFTSTAATSGTCSNITVTAGTGGVRAKSTSPAFKMASGTCRTNQAGGGASPTQASTGTLTGAGCCNGGGAYTTYSASITTTPVLNAVVQFPVNCGQSY